MSSDGRSRAVLDEVESAQEFADPLGSSGAEARVAAQGAQGSRGAKRRGRRRRHMTTGVAFPGVKRTRSIARLRIGPRLLRTCCRGIRGRRLSNAHGSIGLT
jgi:hypothetical protein